MPSLRSLDLFTGIGGIALGFDRAGIAPAAFCEIDPNCRAVLNTHWPDVSIHHDVRTLPVSDYHGVDVVTGGFPCQDVSSSGHKRGINAKRSGLWWEMLRIARELQPPYIFVENVRGLMSSTKPWFGAFLQSLAEIGYDAEWACIPAAYAGAVHHRDRVYVVAYPARRQRRQEVRQLIFQGEFAISSRLERPPGVDRVVSARSRFLSPGSHRLPDRHDGISEAVVRVTQLGNAVVPQIAQAIGEAIVRHARRSA